MKYGLIGENLVHSYSKIIHEYFGIGEYNLVNIKKAELEAFFKKDWKGINVTIPYKRECLKYCDSAAPKAQRTGSANTVIRDADGRLTAHNTDYHGFRHMAEEAGIDFSGKKILILGNGGAAAAVKAVTEDYGGKPFIISRSGENNYSNIEKHYSDTDIIVNATPVGMYPDVDEAPLNLRPFARLSAVMDLIYNPSKTMLLMQAERLGIKTAGGLSMLVWQAARTEELFTGKCFDPDFVREILRKTELKTKNIVIIGMPGAGKTTVGKALAHKLGREFCDTDEAVRMFYGKRPAEIIESLGEEAFRLYEASAAFELGKKSGIVLSCGGGIVEKPENLESLKRNGIIIWLKRDLSHLAVDGRPLSSGGINTVAKLAVKRNFKYKEFADLAVQNNGDIDSVCSEIIKLYEKSIYN